MKKKLTIVLFILSLNLGFSQNYSSNQIKETILKLTERVTDTAFFDYITGQEFEGPKRIYWTYDNITGATFSDDPNYTDNETYKLFQLVYKNGTVQDFLKMTKSENIGINVYGLWALIKNKEFKLVQEQLDQNDYGEVYWNSAGCTAESIKVVDLTQQLIKRMKKYGS